MPSKRPEKDILELFVDKARILNLTTYMQVLSENPEVEYRVLEDGKVLSAVKELTDEEVIRSFLMMLRPFVSEKEDLYFFKIIRHCELYMKRPQDKMNIRKMRDNWQIVMANNTGMGIKAKGKVVTGNEIVKTWLNGEYFHFDSDEIQKIRKSEETPWHPYRTIFLFMIGDLAKIIVRMGEIIEKVFDIRKHYYESIRSQF